jgi:hydrogenase expression/formation protein HypE
MASASGLGVQVDAASIPVLPECREVCKALGLDPMGLIASGALLAAVPPERAAGLIDALGDAGVEAWEIGRFTEPEAGLRLATASGVEELPRFDRDELARYFGSLATSSG